MAMKKHLWAVHEIFITEKERKFLFKRIQKYYVSKGWDKSGFRTGNWGWRYHDRKHYLSLNEARIACLTIAADMSCNLKCALALKRLDDKAAK